MLGYQAPPGADRPQTRHPLGPDPPGSRHPLRQTPQRQTPLRQTSPSQTPPRADTPLPRQTPPGSRHPLGADTPQTRHPPPKRSRLQHTVNERPLRILLECICILVNGPFTRYGSDYVIFFSATIHTVRQRRGIIQ